MSLALEYDKQLFTLIPDLSAAGTNKVPFASAIAFLAEEFPQPSAEQVATLTSILKNLEI